MKRPYFNRQQRVSIYCETTQGALLELNLATKKLLRDVYRTDGWISMKKMGRNIVRLANLKFFGKDAPKKWYQIF